MYVQHLNHGVDHDQEKITTSSQAESHQYQITYQENDKMPDSKDLLILSCSASKKNVSGELPALFMYDGPAYRILRSYIRQHGWPANLKLGILSAEYGLIGCLTTITYYDRRMTPERSAELREAVRTKLKEWSDGCNSLTFVCGKDYLDAFEGAVYDLGVKKVEIVEGPIGKKLQFLSRYLHERHPYNGRVVKEPATSNRLLYFLPDWGDTLDPRFEFETDTFSEISKKNRGEVHVTVLMRPYKVCDGILVSLAQHFKVRGPLKKIHNNDNRVLAPESLQSIFRLSNDQLLLGDCGAFSYVNESKPTLSVELAVSLYDLYGFDMGASVDHIPIPTLSSEEQERRVNLTLEKAKEFIEVYKEFGSKFIPVGVIQGTTPESYALQLPEYVDMGYRYIGIGGLVFRSDKEIQKIVENLVEKRRDLGKPVWIHLFGIFRPKLQSFFRNAGVNSFDSASYFRKAWLRCDQNYLSIDGVWYTAIRVPVSSDSRCKKKLDQKQISQDKVKILEREALDALHLYGRREISLDETLEIVLRYDELVDRNEKKEKNLPESYRKTLEARPWEKCICPICSQIGIDVAIFRGTNRNKRRGIHNTWLLYKKVCESFDGVN